MLKTYLRVFHNFLILLNLTNSFHSSLSNIRTSSTFRGTLNEYIGVEMEPLSEIGRWENKPLKLDVVVAPSKIAKGLGLYIGLHEENTKQTIELGRVLCSYAEGTFQNHKSGDKTVVYSFEDVYETCVVFNGYLTRLIDVILHVTKGKENPNVIYAHKLLFSHDTSATPIPSKANSKGFGNKKGFGAGEAKSITDKTIITIEPDTTSEFLIRGRNIFYVPSSVANDYSNPNNLGQFANDFAYSPLATESSYLVDAASRNSLTIVWNMVIDKGILRPTVPVLVFNKDVVFSNTVPMEIGNTYSWGYWKHVK